MRVNLTQIAEYGGYTNTTTVETYVNSTPSTYNDNLLTIIANSGNTTILDTNFQ